MPTSRTTHSFKLGTHPPNTLHYQDRGYTDPATQLPRTLLSRLYEKSSNTGEPPRHEANHRSIYERLATRTQPSRSLCSSSCSGRSMAASHLLGNTRKPLGGNSFCQSTATPSSAHSFAHLISTSSGSGLFRTLHQIHAPSQGLFYPVRALVLSAVAGVQPQMAQAGKLLLRPPQQRLDPLVIHDLGAVDLRLESTKPSVSTRMWRLDCPLPSFHRRSRALLRPPRWSSPTANPPCPRLAGDLSSGGPATVRGWLG